MSLLHYIILYCTWMFNLLLIIVQRAGHLNYLHNNRNERDTNRNENLAVLVTQSLPSVILWYIYIYTFYLFLSLIEDISVLRYHHSSLLTRKFYIRRNNCEVDSIETGLVVIPRLLPWSDLEHTTFF